MLEAKPSVLKPLDVAVALKISLLEQRSSLSEEEGANKRLEASSDATWSLRQLAKEAHISLGEAHNSVRRLQQSQLVSNHDRKVRRRALHEFLVYGVPYAYPALYGPPVRGIPTAYAAPALKEHFLLSGSETPVWSHFEGEVRGISFSPLYASAPDAALEDKEFYYLLALTDALRGNARVRERTIAAELLRERLLGNA